MKPFSAFLRIHQRGVVYGNLSPNNILIDEEGHIKVIHKIAIETTDAVLAECKYMAPEILEGTEQETPTSDWFVLKSFPQKKLILRFL